MSICFTDDILASEHAKYNSKYYATMVKDLKAAGADVLEKNMGWLLKLCAARLLFRTLKDEAGLLIDVYVHDISCTSGAME